MTLITSMNSDKDDDLFYVVFFDSEDDTALVTFIDGPFITEERAVEYNLKAYNWVKENGFDWIPTEIVSEAFIDKYPVGEVRILN